MSRDITVVGLQIPAMDDEALEKIFRLEEALSHYPQVMIETWQGIYAGVYSRTVRIPAGVFVTGALIKIPTLLKVSGHATFYVGDETMELVGYNVIAASAGRKQACYAHTDTVVTMLFATQAATLEEAENEFTDEAHRLQTRQQLPFRVGGVECLA